MRHDRALDDAASTVDHGSWLLPRANRLGCGLVPHVRESVMNVLLAMGIPTTTDDRGYLLWLAQNWTMLVLPTLACAALLIAWVVRAVRAWTAAPPGSADRPGAQPLSADLSGPSGSPPSPTDPQSRVSWPFDLRLFPRSAAVADMLPCEKPSTG